MPSQPPKYYSRTVIDCADLPYKPGQPLPLRSPFGKTGRETDDFSPIIFAPKLKLEIISTAGARNAWVHYFPGFCPCSHSRFN